MLYDASGSSRLSRRFFDPLFAAGGEVETFLSLKLLSAIPTLNFRNHRKLLLPEGRRTCCRM